MGVQRRFDSTLSAYLCALLAGTMGSALGITMATGLSGSALPRVRAAHLTLNLLGLVGLVIAATLPFFTATQARVKMSPRADRHAQRVLLAWLGAALAYNDVRISLWALVRCRCRSRCLRGWARRPACVAPGNTTQAPPLGRAASLAARRRRGVVDRRNARRCVAGSPRQPCIHSPRGRRVSRRGVRGRSSPPRWRTSAPCSAAADTSGFRKAFGPRARGSG